VLCQCTQARVASSTSPTLRRGPPVGPRISSVITPVAVELRREESRSRLQDRVRPAQLPVLLLEFSDPLTILRRQTRRGAVVDVGLCDPLAHRLDADA